MTLSVSPSGVNHPIDALARGWWVLPLLPDTKRPYGLCRPCAAVKVEPCPACAAGACSGAWCHGIHGASADPEHVRRHWPVGALTGIAVKPSGLAVLDVESDGGAVLADLVASGVLVPTLTLRSASGRGWHLYYRATGGARHLIHPKRADGSGRWPFDVLVSTQARWTGAVVRADPVADWPEGMTRWLAEHTVTNSDPDMPVVRPVAPPSGRYDDMPGCRHNAAFRRSGLDRGRASIAANPTRGCGGDALFAALRSAAYHHGQCSGECLPMLAADLVAAAVAVGVPLDYAERQRVRAFSLTGVPAGNP